MDLPKDPIMLLSFINTQLRDHYASLEALCDDNELDADEIQATLSNADYYYDSVANQFI
ncbi:MAG: DUF4250 domain-containing protein [Lachnospiraceae bacterium]|nr:DUF4250 domain-containing protein [Lachnospiraceae bacterium]